ncbi:prepilin peptidase [Tessaracoccus sp. OS52]|nr:prepilin peptidase [Tessaracoccus sp. OS52]
MAAVIDVVSLRLPDALTIPSYPGLLLLLLPALLLEDAPLLRVALAGLATGAALFVVAWISPRSFGLGDVKLGLTTGAALGWWGWRAVLLGAGAGFLAFSLLGLMLLAMRRVGRRTDLPFGPFLIFGALVGPLLV